MNTTIEKTELDEDLKERLKKLVMPSYRVILHNDDHNDMVYVLKVLLCYIDGMTEPKAVEVMLTAHSKGNAEVIVCPKERAEYYQGCLISSGLTATIEPV